ncbi:Ribosomal protein L25/L23 [Thermodesulfobacterium geofontis OPF15]|jgi:large subunit ribosomal protein L23|uniref:Large ribosomal subunit protein uL23 n=2 Tax=Thermodesulfobacterium geofontis TaxID=1295609 RepID=F8C587_THEGP|nr:50S ribosomal protein L23 [Thermodesulfobacterium geofontis]AEH22856.1 Ribosomal protein L25/L23 [Thermodesulfobacterium geofontis OPF15]
MRDPRTIILAPIITEKSMYLKEKYNQVSFWVDPSANKIEIKKAVEDLFKVKVVDVQTIRVKGKPKGGFRNPGRTSIRKKAIVRLAEGQTIEFFETL